MCEFRLSRYADERRLGLTGVYQKCVIIADNTDSRTAKCCSLIWLLGCLPVSLCHSSRLTSLEQGWPFVPYSCEAQPRNHSRAPNK